MARIWCSCLRYRAEPEFGGRCYSCWCARIERTQKVYQVAANVLVCAIALGAATAFWFLVNQ